MIRAVVNKYVAKVFESPAFQIAVKRAFQKRLTEPHVVNDVVTRTIEFPAFTVPVAKFVRNEVEKWFLEKAEIDLHRHVSNNAVLGHKKKMGDKFPLQKMDSVRFSSPRRTYPTIKTESEGL